jgi:hypothetical protein
MIHAEFIVMFMICPVQSLGGCYVVVLYYKLTSFLFVSFVSRYL